MWLQVTIVFLVAGAALAQNAIAETSSTKPSQRLNARELTDDGKSSIYVGTVVTIVGGIISTLAATFIWWKCKRRLTKESDKSPEAAIQPQLASSTFVVRNTSSTAHISGTPRWRPRRGYDDDETPKRDLEEEWLARARNRRQIRAREALTNPNILKGLRWHLVEANESLPDDAIVASPQPDGSIDHLARVFNKADRHMHLITVFEENGTVQQRSFKWHPPRWPYEVLCGPQGSVEWFDMYKPLGIYTPQMLLVEDTLHGDLPRLHTINRVWLDLSSRYGFHWGGMNCPPNTRDYVKGYLVLKDGTQRADPGLLLVGDLPGAMDENVVGVRTYEVGKPIEFGYMSFRSDDTPLHS